MRNKLLALTTVLLAAATMTACGDRDPVSPAPANPSAETYISAVLDFQSGRVVEPGHEWIDNSGIVHVQGRVFEGGALNGDLIGSIVRTTITHSTYDPRTKERREHRIFECQVVWTSKNLKGKFAGELTQEFADGRPIAFKLLARGDGGFSGMNLTMALQETRPGSGVFRGTGSIK